MIRFTEHVSFKNTDIVNGVRAEILSIIDNICSKNNLQYFAFGNLVVGAVHYNDFIPNGLDSKTEIGLMRDDYEKLVEILKNDGAKYKLDINDRYPSGAKALTLTVSKPIEIEQEDIIYTDVATVEICPFDFVPDSYAEQRSYFRMVDRLAKKYDKMVNATLPYTPEPPRTNKVINLFLATMFYSWRNPKHTYQKLQKIVRNFKDTNCIAQLVPKNGKVITYSDIFPTVRTRVNSATINIPNKTNTWTVKFDDYFDKETKAFQEVSLIVLNEFDRVCREMGIGYFVCGGTMLGYKRHNGFIPWDDDIDVGMLRADYEKFLKEGQKYLSDGFFLQQRSTDKTIPYLFSKVRLDKTTYVTKFNEYRPFHKGMWIDIFPFDYMPNQPAERQKFYNKAITLKNLNSKLFNRYHEKPVYHNPPKTGFERRARIYNEIRRRIIRLVPLSFTQWLYTKHVTKYNKKAKKLGLKTVASFTITYTYADVENMLPYQDINFEGYKVMALKDIDTFLHMQYGDYMQLPLPHQRVGHDLVFWDVEDEIIEKYNLKNVRIAKDAKLELEAKGKTE